MACGEKAFITRQGLQLGLMMATQSSPGRHEDIISTWMSRPAGSDFIFCKQNT